MATNDNDFGPLHALMEDAGEKVAVLTTLHEDLAALKARYLRFALIMLAVFAGLAAISITALVLSYRLVDDVRVQGDKTSELTAGLTLVTGQNRDLIAGLDRVAAEAQENGAQTSRLQCRTINGVLLAIREVIRSGPQGRTPAADKAVAKFHAINCSRLPNAKPDKP